MVNIRNAELPDRVHSSLMDDLISSRFTYQSLGASVPSDHLETEMMNSVIGCGVY
jgi:hypothetical protein